MHQSLLLSVLEGLSWQWHKSNCRQSVEGIFHCKEKEFLLYRLIWMNSLGLIFSVDTRDPWRPSLSSQSTSLSLSLLNFNVNHWPQIWLSSCEFDRKAIESLLPRLPSFLPLPWFSELQLSNYVLWYLPNSFPSPARISFPSPTRISTLWDSAY